MLLSIWACRDLVSEPGSPVVSNEPRYRYRGSIGDDSVSFVLKGTGMAAFPS